MSSSNSSKIPAREIPIPSHLSPEACAQLAFLSQGAMSLPDWPEQDDTTAWLSLIAEQNAHSLADSGFEIDLSLVEESCVNEVTIFKARPNAATADDGPVYLDCHGGALLWGGGERCRDMAAIIAKLVDAEVWAPDYRQPPLHPFPAALDDCVAAYRALLRVRKPDKIIVGGSSAGGNLAAATVLRIRDEGLPMPAAVVLLTPQIDLTESGDTFQTLLGIDTTLDRSLMPANLLYAGKEDRRHPYLSPLFGDFTKGFPPTFLQSGTRDLFLSNTVLMHRALRRAEIDADLHIFDAATHVMFMNGPEAEDFNREFRRFIQHHWSKTNAAL
jgi:monoterpene epsilon-lactone hydrolase